MARSPLRGDRPGTPYGAQPPDDYGAASGGLRTDARSLIEAGDAAYPPELRAAQQRPVDHEATNKLDTKALSGEFGVKVVAASVHGLSDQDDQVLVYLYESDSGRTARWFAPFEAEDVPPEEEGDDGADSEPWPGYDEQSVAEIQQHLDDNTDADLAEVRAYESAHKGRKGVLDYIDDLES